jgi:hypothetical protein
MKQPTTNSQQIVLELTAEQSQQIERTTGKLVTELQIEIVEVAEPPAGAPDAPPARQQEDLTDGEGAQ